MSEYISGLVSVIVPTYRRTDTLDRAISSVLNQSYKNLELLLVNDNIPDDNYSKNLFKQIKKYESDDRFKLILQKKHINGAVARNVGISYARGEYIAFLDDDDWWETDKIKVQIEVLSKLSDDWGGVSCKYNFVNKQGKIIGKSLNYKDGNIYLDILKLSTDVTTCSLLLKHSALDETGYFDENLKRHQDFQLLINFTVKYKLKLVCEYLLNIDVSDNQNRPDGYKLLESKKAFFNSIHPVLLNLSKSDLKCIKCVHKFEIGYVFFKNKNIKNALKYSLSIFTSFKGLILICKKVIRKIKEKKKK